MRIMAFTGPRTVTAVEAYAVRCGIERLGPADVYISGAADGVDTVCGLAALDLFPEAEHRVYVPAAPHNRKAVVQLRRLGAVVVEVPPEDGYAASYMARNDRMVADCTELTGFPYALEEQLRSGTWATIRRARKAHRVVRLLPLREGA